MLRHIIIALSSCGRCVVAILVVGEQCFMGRHRHDFQRFDRSLAFLSPEMGLWYGLLLSWRGCRCSLASLC